MLVRQARPPPPLPVLSLPPYLMYWSEKLVQPILSARAQVCLVWPRVSTFGDSESIFFLATGRAEHSSVSATHGSPYQKKYSTLERSSSRFRSPCAVRRSSLEVLCLHRCVWRHLSRGPRTVRLCPRPQGLAFLLVPTPQATRGRAISRVVIQDGNSCEPAVSFSLYFLFPRHNGPCSWLSRIGLFRE